MMKSLDKKTIIKKLKQYRKESQYKEQIKELGLFGSYARDANSTRSDIDIFVKLEPVKMFDLISIKEDLEGFGFKC